ncbi:MAG: hypothetical protein JNL82_42230 [Myxococcales bacterium]|nr:hypothetical protein [Myxococcales bacterium]
MVWGGATLDAIARLRREFKAMEVRRLDVRRFVRPPRDTQASAKEKFDCFFLCDECGYLCDKNPPCPSCGSTSWIDLDVWANAEALRALEEDARRHPPKWLRTRVNLTALAAGSLLGAGATALLALGGVLALGPLGFLVFGTGATGLATAYTHELAKRRIARTIVADRVDKPTRWHLPLPLLDPTAPDAARIVGAAEPRAPLLRAPFSGRLCVAYEAAILFDHPEDAWPPTWVLREMRSAPFEVQGRLVEADRAALLLPTEPIDDPVLDEAAKHQYLRERGLFLADGRFDLFESVVLPNHPYELAWPTSPRDAPPFVRPSRALPPGDPYRG